jgi:hypothetical protein
MSPAATDCAQLEAPQRRNWHAKPVPRGSNRTQTKPQGTQTAKRKVPLPQPSPEGEKPLNLANFFSRPGADRNPRRGSRMWRRNANMIAKRWNGTGKLARTPMCIVIPGNSMSCRHGSIQIPLSHPFNKCDLAHNCAGTCPGRLSAFTLPAGPAVAAQTPLWLGALQVASGLAWDYMRWRCELRFMSSNGTHSDAHSMMCRRGRKSGHYPAWDPSCRQANME